VHFIDTEGIKMHFLLTQPMNYRHYIGLSDQKCSKTHVRQSRI